MNVRLLPVGPITIRNPFGVLDSVLGIDCILPTMRFVARTERTLDSLRVDGSARGGERGHSLLKRMTMMMANPTMMSVCKIVWKIVVVVAAAVVMAVVVEHAPNEVPKRIEVVLESSFQRSIYERWDRCVWIERDCRCGLVVGCRCCCCYCCYSL